MIVVKRVDVEREVNSEMGEVKVIEPGNGMTSS